MSAIAAQPWTAAKPVVRTGSTTTGRAGARPARHLVVVPDVTSLPATRPAAGAATRPAARATTRPASRPALRAAGAAGAGGLDRGVARPAPLRLTRRGRVVLVVLGLLVVLGGVMGGRAVADGPERAVEVVTHAVQSGETLWQIAAGVTAPGQDVRDVVAELQELNGLADGSLAAGQVLLLPADA